MFKKCIRCFISSNRLNRQGIHKVHSNKLGKHNKHTSRGNSFQIWILFKMIILLKTTKKEFKNVIFYLPWSLWLLLNYINWLLWRHVLALGYVLSLGHILALLGIVSLLTELDFNFNEFRFICNKNISREDYLLHFN